MELKFKGDLYVANEWTALTLASISIRVNKPISMEKTLEFGPKDVPVDDLNCGRSSTELQAPGPGQSDAQTLPGRRQLPRVAAKLSSPENKLTVKLFFSKLFHLRFACHREAVTDLAEFSSPFNHDLITAVLLTGLLRSRSG